LIGSTDGVATILDGLVSGLSGFSLPSIEHQVGAFILLTLLILLSAFFNLRKHESHT
jgi:hydrogenase/urease accessory protein HupE